MEHLSAKVLRSLFSPNEIIDIVSQGVIKHGKGEYRIPERTHINRGDSSNLIMPAFGTKYFCTKLISVDPHNNKKNLPIISGILVLNDHSTGMPLATFDAPIITALRTGAIGAIGLNLTWKKNEVKLGIIGLGVQGYWQTIFAATAKKISLIYCYSRSKANFSSYKSEVLKQFPNINITYCDSAEEVVTNADVIITCTTSSHPVFNAKNLTIVEKRFISIGSFTKSMQELPEQVYIQADALIIDSNTAKTEVGDLIKTIKNQWIPYAQIHTLVEVISGKTSVANYKNLVFKSVGMATFDLALATAAYEKHFKLKD